ncbi:MAG: response regulator [Methanomicrobiales archaeon]
MAKQHNEDLIVCEGRILVHMPRVLVIDDAEYARDILKKILIRGGYEIAGEAGDGEAGVSEFSRTKPDIVIVDMIMPKMNGIETIRAIKKLDPDAKIIVISADGQMAHIEEAVKAGALSYINKPYQWSVVINELLQLTGGPQ